MSLDKRMLQDVPRKGSEALGAPSDGQSFARPISDERAACLPGSSDGARHVSLQEPTGTMDGASDADTRDRPEQGALRVSQDPRTAQPRGLGCGEVSGVPVVHRRRSDVEQAATAQEESSAASGRTFYGLQLQTRPGAIDFLADQLHDGTRFRALTILDVYTREGVAIEAGQSLKGEDVV